MLYHSTTVVVVVTLHSVDGRTRTDGRTAAVIDIRHLAPDFRVASGRPAYVQICQKGRRIGCVIPHCNFQHGITQPILRPALGVDQKSTRVTFRLEAAFCITGMDKKPASPFLPWLLTVSSIEWSPESSEREWECGLHKESAFEGEMRCGILSSWSASHSCVCVCVCAFACGTATAMMGVFSKSVIHKKAGETTTHSPLRRHQVRSPHPSRDWLTGLGFNNAQMRFTHVNSAQLS